MGEAMDYLLGAVLIGAGATAVMDIWTVARKWLLGTKPPDYGLVGRWLAYMVRGRFRHDSITASPAVHGERRIGWTAHYLIGIAFAAMLLAIWGLDWVRQPTIAPALIVGIGSVAAPFFLMQPSWAPTSPPAARRGPPPPASKVSSPTLFSAWDSTQRAGWQVSWAVCDGTDFR